MKATRRKFLTLAGLTALGVGAAPAAFGSYLPHYEHITTQPEALRATRWGMVVDTRQFHTIDDFKPLIKACHEAHNVPGWNDKQEIKWIWYDTFHAVFPNTYQYVSHATEEKPYLLLCNHCEEPPCVKVCPTQATFKRADGIVMMDMHRCIGCRFCMAGCPFGARSFNFRDPRTFYGDNPVPNKEFPTRTKGVVEKCTFCYERLAEGLLPACVEASQGKVIFGDLEDPNSNVRQALAANYHIRRKPDLGTNPSVFYII